MKIDFFVRLLGRERAWRLGRKLYMAARGETANDIDTNGEADLLRECVRAFAERGEAGPFVAFDIGANLGLWTTRMLDAASTAEIACRVELFEPVPGAFARLAARFPEGGPARLHQIAVSNRTGTSTMQIVGEFAGTNSLGPSDDPAATSIAVETVALPEIKQRLGIGEIHLLKIDAEGHDIEILRGMAETLREREVQVVQFEYNWRWLNSRAALRDVFKLIAGLDYRLARLTSNGLDVYETWNAENDRYFENNYALVRTDILAGLKHRLCRWDVSNVLAPIA